MYGSILDGGVINGREIPSFIGQLATQENLNLIKAEIVDLLQKYQQMQLAKMKKELIENNGRHTLSGDEVLHTINSIELGMLGTTILVRVTCTTLNKTTLNITIPLAV